MPISIYYSVKKKMLACNLDRVYVCVCVSICLYVYAYHKCTKLQVYTQNDCAPRMFKCIIDFAQNKKTFNKQHKEWAEEYIYKICADEMMILKFWNLKLNRQKSHHTKYSLKFVFHLSMRKIKMMQANKIFQKKF